MSSPSGLPERADVVIAGAGPVGATLALDLARRGVECVVLEQSPSPRKLPKMERCNARTMEIFRRFGIAQTVRDASGFTPMPMDIFVMADMSKEPLLHLRYPSVPEAQETVRRSTDGSQPLEPQQIVSQYTLEPILREAASKAGADLHHGAELVSFAQDAEGVDLDISLHDGGTHKMQASWLVGCDGGVSTVRKTLGIKLEGDGRIRRLHQVFFYSEKLYDSIPCGKGRHYYLPEGALAVQDDMRHFVLNFVDWQDGDDAAERLRVAIDLPVDIEVLHEQGWNHHLLVAERYRVGRAFIAGDAAHLVIPQGGLGMNTGVGDAVDLGWKLAGTVYGWGGPELLASYESERREVGLRNREASRSAANGVMKWRSAITDRIREDSVEGQRVRDEVSRLAAEYQYIGHEIAGTELGYRYSDSPIVLTEEAPVDSGMLEYVPTTTPGARIPHVWLEDGRAVQDLLGEDFTLLQVTGDDCGDVDAVVAAFEQTGVPITFVQVDSERARRVYERNLVLVRPDLHVVWRGDESPKHPDTLAAVASGHVDARDRVGSFT